MNHTHTPAQTPAPKMDSVTPEEKKALDRKVDEQVEESFPASDPPSYSGGEHIIGAPKARESEPPKPDDEAVVEAEEKVKKGEASKLGNY